VKDDDPAGLIKTLTASGIEAKAGGGRQVKPEHTTVANTLVSGNDCELEDVSKHPGGGAKEHASQDDRASRCEVTPKGSEVASAKKAAAEQIATARPAVGSKRRVPSILTLLTARASSEIDPVGIEVAEDARRMPTESEEPPAGLIKTLTASGIEAKTGGGWQAKPEHAAEPKRNPDADTDVSDEAEARKVKQAYDDINELIEKGSYNKSSLVSLLLGSKRKKTHPAVQELVRLIGEDKAHEYAIGKWEHECAIVEAKSSSKSSSRGKNPG